MSPAVITALAQMDTALSDLAERLAAAEALLREVKTRNETMYRKVYRDAAKGDGQGEEESLRQVVKQALPRVIRPGDAVEEF